MALLKEPDSALREKINWDTYFCEALEGKGQEHKNPAWWSIVDRDANKIVKKQFSNKNSISVLEAGCGSGGTSFSLSEFVSINKLCLMDISPNALDFAKTLEKESLRGKVEYVQDNILTFTTRSTFDLVWNVGVVEHYEPTEIEKMVERMFLSTAVGGCLLIGIPNRKSIAVLKAALLGSNFGKKFLSLIPGYRNTTEIFYSDQTIAKIIFKVTNLPVEILHAGSFLWVGAPSPLVLACDKLFNPNSFSFLTFFLVRKPTKENTTDRYASNSG